MNTLTDETYRKLHTLLALIDSNTFQLSYDYNKLNEDDRKKIGADTLTVTRAIREITGLNAHQEMVKKQLEQEQLQDLDKHKEYIEEFSSTITEELTAIKNPQYFRNYKTKRDATSAADLFDVTIEHHPSSNIHTVINELNATKEQWLVAIENPKAHFEKQYQDFKQYEIKDTDQYKEQLKSFGKPITECTEHPKAVLKEVFVDEEILELTKGFMLGPVGLFNNKAVVAFNEQIYDSLDELKQDLTEQSKTKDVVIYYTAKQGDKYIFRGGYVDKD